MKQVKTEDNRTMCEICSKLTIKTEEKRHVCRSGCFTVNCQLLLFFKISHIALVFQLSNLTSK